MPTGASSGGSSFTVIMGSLSVSHDGHTTKELAAVVSLMFPKGSYIKDLVSSLALLGGSGNF